MKYVRDIAIARPEPFIVDWPVEADTVKAGEVMRLGLADTDDLNFAVSGEGAIGLASTGHIILGVMNEGLTSTLDIDTPATYALHKTSFGKIIINPFGVFEAEYSTAAADDLDVVESGTTTKATCACTGGIGSPYLGGSWLYFRYGTGIGALALIEDSATDSTDLDMTTANTMTHTPDSTSRIVIIYGRGQRVIRLGDVDIVQHADADYDSVPSTQTYGIGVTIVENYIQTTSIRRRVMQKGGERGQGTDIGRTGLHNANVRFYSHLVFGGLSHVFACSDGIKRG